MARPCVHGEVCRAYMRRFGILAILSKKCPKCGAEVILKG